MRAAKTTEEKIAALEQMLRVVPKHKGTDGLQADLKARLAKLRRQPAKKAARAACHDIARAGPAPSRGEARVPPIPLDPAVLEKRLDALMGPLVALRPPGAVASALREIVDWPLQAEQGIEEGGALAGIRRLAALAVLTGEMTRNRVE